MFLSTPPSLLFHPPIQPFPAHIPLPTPLPPQSADAPPPTTCSKILTTQLSLLSTTASSLPVQIPPEIVAYVEDGRNPDIYTREFVELVQKGNQYLKGKAEAFESFRDVLAREMEGAMPEVGEEVRRVVDATGGKGMVGRVGEVGRNGEIGGA